MSTTFKKEDGDFLMLPTGRFRTIFNEEKLAQDAGDMLTTEYDPARGFGTALSDAFSAASNPNVMTVFGEAYIARIAEDALDRYRTLQDRDPRTDETERLDRDRCEVRVFIQDRKYFLLYVRVVPVAGTSNVLGYRVRMRNQYFGRSARQIFPLGVVTDDMVP